jgi:hypothetical protein
MAFKAFYREDIRNALEAAQLASEGSSMLLAQVLSDAQIQDVPVDRALDIYRQGFCTALATVARTFGVGGCTTQGIVFIGVERSVDELNCVG